RVVFGVDLRNARGELHRVDAWEDDRRNAAGVPTAAEVNHRRIVAETAYVNADENYVGEEVELSVDSGASKLEGDKGLRVHSRENAAHTDSNEVVVLAVVGYPLSDLNLVGDRHIAGVDGLGPPPVGELPAGETFAEAALVPRRVSEGAPDDLGVRVG